MRPGRAPARVAVLGAGVTGLTAAYELTRQAQRQRRCVEVIVLESSSRTGGKVQTEVRDGAVIEAGPDSFITTKPQALELIRELGLSGDLIKTNPGAASIYVCSKGRLRALPDGMSFLPTRMIPFVLSDLLTWSGKARILIEPWVPAAQGEQDESLASFVKRRLGPEALDLVIGPMLAGIYAGDAEQLSVGSTFPQLKEMERRGGLMRALWRARTWPRFSRPRAPSAWAPLRTAGDRPSALRSLSRISFISSRSRSAPRERACLGERPSARALSLSGSRTTAQTAARDWTRGGQAWGSTSPQAAR